MEFDLKRAMEERGIATIAFSRLTGISDRTIQRWCAGQTKMPAWVPLLLRCMALVPREEWQGPVEEGRAGRWPGRDTWRPASRASR